MNLDHLKYFCDAAQAGGLAASSKRNLVSPSAVSQAIRMLEQNLGVELIEHGRNKFVLTEHGQKLAELSRPLFDAVQGVREEVKFLNQAPAGTLTFGISHSIALSVLPTFLARFSAKYPGIFMHLKTGVTAHLKELLRTGVTEFGVFVEDGQLQGFDRQVLHSGVFILAGAKKSKLKPDAPFMITEMRPDLAQFLGNYRHRFKREPGVTMQIESWEIIAHLAASGLGVGFIPDFFLGGPLGKQLKVLDLGLPKIRYDLCLVRWAKKKPSKNALLFAEALRQHLKPS